MDRRGRRAFVAGTMASFAALLWLPARWLGASSARAQAASPTRTFYRLTPTSPGDDAFGGPSPRVAGRRVYRLYGRYWIWATQDEAVDALVDARVHDVAPKAPSDVGEDGSMAGSDALYVTLAELWHAEGVPSVDEAKAELERTLGPLRWATEADLGEHRSFFVELVPHQVAIPCARASERRRAREVARSHPLVFQISWGRPDAMHGCPMCGIG